MKFLLTMNMPSAKNYLVHQLTVDYPVSSCVEFCKHLNQYEFIVCHLFYRRTLLTGEMGFEDRGEIVLNTGHIGKAQEYIEDERFNSYDESHGHSQASSPHFAGERVTIRKRGSNI